MASINKQTISGDLDVGRNTATGGNLAVTGKAEFGGSVTVKGFLDAPNLKVPFKGVFETDAALKNAYPRPQSGWYAYAEAMETDEGEAKPDGSTDTNRLYWVLRAYNGKWEESGYDSLNVTTDVERLVDSVDGENGINARLGELESTVDALSSQVNGSDGEGADTESDGASLTEKVSTLQKDVQTLQKDAQTLQDEVKALDESETQSALKHYTENVAGLEYTTESATATTGTNALLALNKDSKNGRVKLAAESVFIETSDFEVEKTDAGGDTGRIIKKDTAVHGGSIYLTTPDGIIERGCVIELEALQRVDRTDSGSITNGIIQLYTTYDKDLKHNNSRVLCERDIFNGDLDEIPTADADGKTQEAWALDARLAKKIVNGAWGGSVRFNGVAELGTTTLVTDTELVDNEEGNFIGVLWLTDKKMFVGVKARVYVDCGKEIVEHTYYTRWSTSEYYMETPGEEGGLWKEKVYIHTGGVWVWKECENQLVKAGKTYHPVTEEQIDKLMEDFKFVEMGNLIRKIKTETEDPLGLSATYEDETVTLKGKVALDDIGADEVNEMFEEVAKG